MTKESEIALQQAHRSISHSTPVNIVTSNKVVAKEGVFNGQSIWAPGKGGDPVRNAFSHWKDHGHEFSGLQNSKHYVEQAHNLFRDPSVLRRIRSIWSGVYGTYPLTNTFGSFTAEGVPKTMFKPGGIKTTALKIFKFYGVFLWTVIRVLSIAVCVVYFMVKIFKVMITFLGERTEIALPLIFVSAVGWNLDTEILS